MKKILLHTSLSFWILQRISNIVFQFTPLTFIVYIMILFLFSGGLCHFLCCLILLMNFLLCASIKCSASSMYANFLSVVWALTHAIISSLPESHKVPINIYWGNWSYGNTVFLCTTLNPLSSLPGPLSLSQMYYPHASEMEPITFSRQTWILLKVLAVLFLVFFFHLLGLSDLCSSSMGIVLLTSEVGFLQLLPDSCWGSLLFIFNEFRNFPGSHTFSETISVPCRHCHFNYSEEIITSHKRWGHGV
jgi:hypothetical protein